MQNNYYFLKKISERLDEAIVGFKVAECYSQNKDELIITFTNPNNDEFFIRAMLRPDFCCLSFPEKLHRARRNSVDLFDAIIEKEVKEVFQYENERSFRINFNDGFSLLFKMHGNRSNIILLKDDNPEALFNNRIPQDWELIPAALNRPIDQSFDAFAAVEGDISIIFPTFGKEVKAFLKEEGYRDLRLEEKWNLIRKLLNDLTDENFYIVNGNPPEFYLFQTMGEVHSFKDPLEAISTFYVQWLSSKQFYGKRNLAVKKLKEEIKRDKAYIKTTTEKLEQLEKDSNYRQWADLIMANLNNIHQGQKEATVSNFYNEGNMISIKMNRTLSPQKNAERYYQKAKNQHKEMEIHREGLMTREMQLEKKVKQLEALENAMDVKEVESLVSIKKTKNKAPNMPYYHFNIEGYEVLVGKSAKHNDLLLQQHSRKDDLWLHARGVSGSHVIIRKVGKENIPSVVIEKAAQLAAFNSKGKTDSLCPVIFTQRKYVRKRKGDPPGAVVVDREEVIMVEPALVKG